MRILIGLLKFILGVALALAILGASGFYGVRYVMTRLAVPPERPLFSGEEGTKDGDVPFDEELASSDPNSTAGVDDAPGVTNQGNEESAPIESESEPEPELEPGAYNARVIQPIGLILRQGPDVSTTQIGGIAYNESVIVLSESSDQRWIKVRLPDSGVEGWVKNGNTEKINE